VGEPRRLRGALAVAAACLLVLGSAVLYLRPLPGRPAAPPAAPPTPEPVTVRLEDFEAAARVAWVCLVPVGYGVALGYATADGGRTWRNLTFPSPDPAGHKFGVQLIDAAHGVLQLSDGLYTTADGGGHWRIVPLPPGQRFGPGAHFLSPSEGWYQDLAAYPNQTQQPSAMWWTSNGGASWSERWRVDSVHPLAGGLPLDGSKYVLGFRDASTGWLSVTRGGASTLLATSDGGRAWSPVDLPLRERAVFSELELPPDGSAVLLASTGSGYLALPSRDGGRTWEAGRPIPMASTPDRGENRPSFIDHDHWATAGGSLVHVTSDAGRTWRTVNASLPPGIAALVDLWLTGGGEGWATGADGFGNLRVLRTGDGGAHWARSPVPELDRS